MTSVTARAGTPPAALRSFDDDEAQLARRRTDADRPTATPGAFAPLAT
jgi:hypothetical protein